MALQIPASESGSMRVIMPLLGIPFFLIGLYLLVGRPYLDKLRRARTVYGITDRRVLWVTAGKSRKVRSIHLDQITDVQVTEKKDHSGDIRVLARDPSAYAKAGRELRFGLPVGNLLESLPRVKEVWTKLQQARAEVSGA